MEKSIETIWKEGFLDDKALVAPKLNDLYNQKSKHIVDKIKKMMVWNRYGLILLAALTLIIYSAMGSPGIAVFMAALMVAITFWSKFQERELKGLDIGRSSFEYLTSFDNWLKENLNRHSKVLRFMYPIIFLSVSTAVWNYAVIKGVPAIIQEKFPSLSFTWGVPTVGLIVALIITLLLTLFGKRIYKWDIMIVYGRVFRKLQAMISDMEELRK